MQNSNLKKYSEPLKYLSSFEKETPKVGISTNYARSVCHCINLSYQVSLDRLVPGDRSYWLHARLDPCGALNLVCSRQLVSDRKRAGAHLHVTAPAFSRVDQEISSGKYDLQFYLCGSRLSVAEPVYLSMRL